MPSRGTIDGAPAAFTDHQIQRLPVEEELARKPAALVRWRPGPGECATQLGPGVSVAGAQQQSPDLLGKALLLIAEARQAFPRDRELTSGARNFFDGSKKAPLRQNIFGFAVGGPIKKNTTFFLVGEDWRRRSVGQTLRGAFPDQAIRGGDFTDSGTLGTGGLKLDASSVNLENQLHPGVQCITNSTHLNPACFDPNAVAIMSKYWPLPNNPGGFLNYINGAEKFPQRDDTYRVDQYFSERFTLMGRVSYETARDTPAAETWNGLVAPTLGQSIKTDGLQWPAPFHRQYHSQDDQPDDLYAHE